MREQRRVGRRNKAADHGLVGFSLGWDLSATKIRGRRRGDQRWIAASKHTISRDSATDKTDRGLLAWLEVKTGRAHSDWAEWALLRSVHSWVRPLRVYRVVRDVQRWIDQRVSDESPSARLPIANHGSWRLFKRVVGRDHYAVRWQPGSLQRHSDFWFRESLCAFDGWFWWLEQQ